MRTVTKSWEKTLSKLFVLDNQQLSIPSLLLLGTIAGLMYTHLRYPLNIPGHHGLEWMALVMFGRCLSSQRYAATILATGAVAGYLAQIPLLSLTNEFKPVFVFLISGFFADTIYRLTLHKEHTVREYTRVRIRNFVLILIVRKV